MASIITVPAFSDNYIWLICDKDKNRAAIVDPGDAAPVVKVLQEHVIKPVAIFITHFHSDHVGGIGKLLEVYPGLPVYGPKKERIPHMTHPLNGTETIGLDVLDIKLNVMNVPGHTAGHIAYYDEQNSNLFCGDTLFACGCGRVFDGTLQDLHDSLQTIAQLPEQTQIYCAHEYTLDNIGFAKWVEPENKALLAREEAAMALIDNDQPTVPSELALELETNPFLRTNQPDVVKRVEQATSKSLNNSAEVFAAMRTWKDSEYD